MQNTPYAIRQKDIRHLKKITGAQRSELIRENETNPLTQKLEASGPPDVYLDAYDLGDIGEAAAHLGGAAAHAVLDSGAAAGHVLAYVGGHLVCALFAALQE